MSTEAIVWAMEQQAGGPAEKLILMLIGDMIDSDGRFEIDTDYLGRIAELSAPDVRGLIDRLSRQKLVNLEPGGWLRLAMPANS